MADHDHHDHHDHDHDHDDHGHHGHGHASDQGLAATWRYLKLAPRMWSSEVNDAVVDLVDPRPGETVVDIGAGFGPAALRAAGRGASVIAVEPTPFMRRVATGRRLVSKHRGRITVIDGGAEALPLDDHAADAVWAVNTMHHWISPAEGAAEIARVLAPGGRAVLVDENFEDPTHLEYERFAKRHRNRERHGFSMIDADEIGKLMTAAGLTDVVAEARRMAGRPVLAVLASAPIDG
jgi:SAM-dependent methyltransferase